MENDLISRSAALYQLDRREKYLAGDKRISFDSIRKFIINRPAVEAEPVRHGRWEYDPGDTIPHCNQCAMPQDVPTNYCHNCGAKMEAKE